MHNPIAYIKTSIFGPKTEGAMAREIPLEGQRPAQYVFGKHVEDKMASIKASKAGRVRVTRSSSSAEVAGTAD